MKRRSRSRWWARVRSFAWAEMTAVVGFLAMGVLAGCTSGGGPMGPVEFPAEAFTALPSDAARFLVTVRTFPQPPTKGVDAVQLRVTDADGAPVDGLEVAAVPWMPAHGHGTGARTLVEPQGDGLYEITNVYFYMAGQWELRSTLGSAAGPDAVTPVFDVR